jgi:hypothetical protein
LAERFGLSVALPDGELSSDCFLAMVDLETVLTAWFPALDLGWRGAVALHDDARALLATHEEVNWLSHW